MNKGTFMVKYLVVFCLLLSLNIQAEEYVLGEGRFNATDDDSLGFVKKQVIHQGFLDVISKELETMGLNKDLFWQKYDEKSKNSFASVELSLKEKYKIG